MNNVKQTQVRDFEADRKICDAATVGPWDVRLWGADFTVTNIGVPLAKAIDPQDARFIAEARTGWPVALDRIAKLEKRWKTLVSVVETNATGHGFGDINDWDIMQNVMDDIARGEFE